MLAHGTLKGQPKSQDTFWILIVSLMAFLVASSSAIAASMVNSTPAMKISAITSNSNLRDSPNIQHAKLAIVPDLIPHAALGAGVVRWTISSILKEVGKQAIDQPGHFLIGAAPIWASRYLVGVPWFGWVAAPILAYREWLQWPSKRWWDPPLDWASLTLGAVAATWSRRRRYRLPVGFAAFGRRMASGLAVRGRMPQRV